MFKGIWTKKHILSFLFGSPTFKMTCTKAIDVLIKTLVTAGIQLYCSHTYRTLIMNITIHK